MHTLFITDQPFDHNLVGYNLCLQLDTFMFELLILSRELFGAAAVVIGLALPAVAFFGGLRLALLECRALSLFEISRAAAKPQ